MLQQILRLFGGFMLHAGCHQVRIMLLHICEGFHFTRASLNGIAKGPA